MRGSSIAIVDNCSGSAVNMCKISEEQCVEPYYTILDLSCSAIGRTVQVKTRKLQELQASGVPDRYQAELARLQIKSAK